MDFNTSVKDLILDYDFKYFLTKHIEDEHSDYSNQDIEKLYQAYDLNKEKLKQQIRNNKKQASFYIENQVRKMWSGGMLPDLFQLSENRGWWIIDFPAFGNDLAYLTAWQEHQKSLQWKKKTWDLAVKTGTVLAYLLSISKLIEYLIPLFKQ
ncbi:MAG TPA: hypothetical protein VF677_04980 [Flavobacterium sp.]|jgi:hypothetical protein